MLLVITEVYVIYEEGLLTELLNPVETFIQQPIIFFATSYTFTCR